MIAEAHPAPGGTWVAIVPKLQGLLAEAPTLSQIPQAVADAANGLGYAISAESIGVRAATR
ncbi:hypothetical protein MKOR_11860 [Mycolicibacillus koreensis]|uniref:Uncharacterized protein n=1 Tax=Mycolicibacillus koreensis TaxID=1069220 RepID=A0A7I7SD32_9MYCO|nr:hypothetical protein B8W67_06490 [Mycolicibacillus koreensis]BBY53935.1 hypothetical protein MKOR_11860 [Mycolicibacillus koreensis]